MIGRRWLASSSAAIFGIRIRRVLFHSSGIPRKRNDIWLQRHVAQEGPNGPQKIWRETIHSRRLNQHLRYETLLVALLLDLNVGVDLGFGAPRGLEMHFTKGKVNLFRPLARIQASNEKFDKFPGSMTKQLRKFAHGCLLIGRQGHATYINDCGFVAAHFVENISYRQIPFRHSLVLIH